MTRGDYENVAIDDGVSISNNEGVLDCRKEPWITGILSHVITIFMATTTLLETTK